jgi:predicted RNase H-like HicB family nuclease
MKYLVVIEKGGNSLGAYVPDLPGGAVVGETREEALQLIREAVDQHVSSLSEHDDPLPALRNSCWRDAFRWTWIACCTLRSAAWIVLP